MGKAFVTDMREENLPQIRWERGTAIKLKILG
jgi:hypothetical protein